MTQEVYKQKIQRMKELDKADKSMVISILGHGMEAFNSVPTAIFSFLSHPQSFEEAIIYSISLGGDTDTITAMTGAISGAYLGVEAIPERWKIKLENGEYLEKLAKELLGIKT